MKSLQQTLEGLLDDDFDITETDLLVNALVEWMKDTKTNKSYDDAKAKLLWALKEPAEAINPMQQTKHIASHTVIEISDKRRCIHIMHNEGKMCSSYISFEWNYGPPICLSGRNNLFGIKNHRKGSGYACFIMPPEVFDELYRLKP